MPMSNLLGVWRVRSVTMAARTPQFGIDHPTVVPTNFDPDDDESDDPAGLDEE